MANLRDLKKDINWITEEVIADCLIFLDINPEQDSEAVAEIINKIVDKRNELITQVNLHDKLEKGTNKKEYFRNIAKELIETADSCFNDLSGLVKK